MAPILSSIADVSVTYTCVATDYVCQTCRFYTRLYIYRPVQAVYEVNNFTVWSSERRVASFAAQQQNMLNLGVSGIDLQMIAVIDA